MRRPKTFDDIVGHDWQVGYLRNNIMNGKLHHFLILEGPEGLGKTSIADCIAMALVYGLEVNDAYEKAYNDIVVTGKSNDYIKRFKCSVEGGKDVAKEIKDEMNPSFVVGGPKVIICDECHGLTKQAQDVFLSETEFIDKNVYLIMLTTEINQLKPSLRSRAVIMHLSPLKKQAMLRVLKDEVQARNLRLQNETATLDMIAEWSQYKPRAALNLLNAFSEGTAVSSNDIRELIGYLSVVDVLPVLTMLSGSITHGLAYIQEMTIDETMISIVIECIQIKAMQASYKLKLEEAKMVRDGLADVDEDQLVTFLFNLTKQTPLTRTAVINAFIAAHNNRDILVKEDTTSSLLTEQVQRQNVILEEEVRATAKAPTLDDLLLSSKIIM